MFYALDAHLGLRLGSRHSGTHDKQPLSLHNKARAQDEVRHVPLLVAVALLAYPAAASDVAPAPASVPTYNGRPNNGGYPYPTATPQATKPCENKTEAPAPPSGPIYYGRPNNGGYPYPTPAPDIHEGSKPSEDVPIPVTPTPANGPIYYGRPNNGGYPYATAPPPINSA
ncbi:hypothetical protein GN244_ATG17280 [Phytophthora infestans]|uniref:Uncharacterized protein n=1 Tax=Phytophthora infestans TaxID=4787 RepID=A0A833SZ41_PHYIN|nr:hypothetical protein GN244_ATG17280 [Phytophthora infestans]